MNSLRDLGINFGEDIDLIINDFVDDLDRIDFNEELQKENFEEEKIWEEILKEQRADITLLKIIGEYVEEEEEYIWVDTKGDFYWVRYGRIDLDIGVLNLKDIREMEKRTDFFDIFI